MRRITKLIEELKEIEENYGNIEVLSDESWNEIYEIVVKKCPITKEYYAIIK